MDVLQDWMINIQDYVRFNSDIANAAIDWSRLTVRDYITETGVQIKIMAGHLFVLEFDQELAHQVNIYRLILSDLVRFYTIFFFFRQKTAYEMCGRDWSSDVCSSDLEGRREGWRATGRDGGGE